MRRIFPILIALVWAVGNAWAQGPSEPLTQTFSQPNFGYSLRYPASWVMERMPDYTVVFAGAPGTADQYVSLAISNRRSSHRVAALMQTYLSELDAAKLDATLLTNVPFIYKRDNVVIEGAQAVTEFTNRGGRLRQWTVILPRPGGAGAHVWSYTADIMDFEAHLATVQAMLESWVLLGDDIR